MRADLGSDAPAHIGVDDITHHCAAVSIERLAQIIGRNFCR
jgi:hypothetical protein